MEGDMDNLLHRVVILEKVIEFEKERRKTLENVSEEEAEKRREIEEFLRKEIAQRKEIEELLRKEIAQRKELEKLCLAGFFGMNRIPHGGIEQPVEVSTGTHKEETPPVGEGACVQERASNIVEDVKRIANVEDLGDDKFEAAEDATHGEELVIDDSNNNDDDTSSHEDFKTNSVVKSFRNMQQQLESDSASSESTNAERSDRKRNASEALSTETIIIKPQTFTCRICSKRYSLEMKLKSHMKRRHDKSLKGPAAERSVAPKSDRELVKCLHCEKLFTSSRKMRVHLMVHYPTKNVALPRML